MDGVARWTASEKWAAGPALVGQCATPLGLSLSEGLDEAATAEKMPYLFRKVHLHALDYEA